MSPKRDCSPNRVKPLFLPSIRADAAIYIEIGEYVVTITRHKDAATEDEVDTAMPCHRTGYQKAQATYTRQQSRYAEREKQKDEHQEWIREEKKKRDKKSVAPAGRMKQNNTNREAPTAAAAAAVHQQHSSSTATVQQQYGSSSELSGGK